MSIEEHIAFLEYSIQESLDIIKIGLKEKDFIVVSRNSGSIISDILNVGLIKWRHGKNATNSFVRLLEFIPEGMNAMEAVDMEASQLYPLDTFETIYVAYLIGHKHPLVDLTKLEKQARVEGFFGNVLMGYADITEWPKYREAIPNGKRYNLARKTNELYAGLLAGSVSAEDGVKIGEQLWAEREDDVFFDTGRGGFGNGNKRMVDYQLGAILKKIGSTVPTLHAWRW